MRFKKTLFEKSGFPRCLNSAKYYCFHYRECKYLRIKLGEMRHIGIYFGKESISTKRLASCEPFCQ